MNLGKTRPSLIYVNLEYAELEWLLSIRLIAAILALAFFLLNINISRKTVGYTPWVFLFFSCRQIITFLLRSGLLMGIVDYTTREIAVTLAELFILAAAIRFWFLMRDN